MYVTNIVLGFGIELAFLNEIMNRVVPYSTQLYLWTLLQGAP